MSNEIKTWTLTLPTGATMSASIDCGKPGQVNTQNAAGKYTGSMPLAAWLEGVEKAKAAGATVVEA